MQINPKANNNLEVNNQSFTQQIIDENNKVDLLYKESRITELKYIVVFLKTMIWAFPVAKLMRWYIRKNKKLQYILQFKELLPARNNIEKSSFAYDSLLFKESFFSILKNKSHLANLVCLSIIFGDEFIDGIATAHGKENTGVLLKNEAYNFNLQFKKNNSYVELYYEFDIRQLLPAKVLNTINTKYAISYDDFYQHLLFLLAEMNRHLKKLDNEKATQSAELICKVCNLCFDTYKTDVTNFHEDYELDELLAYQKNKDDDIVTVLLTLRAVLLDKKQLHFQKEFASWSSILRSMQLYDDMEDVAKDCDFQMNLCCWFARNYFINEWEWLQQNKTELALQKGIQLNATIALHMPASCMLLMQNARHISHSKFTWVQRKIINYLWRKNWLGFNNKVLNDGSFTMSSFLNKPDSSIPLQFHLILSKVNSACHELITNEMKLCWALDIALMDKNLRKTIAKKIGRKAFYNITNCFLDYPTMQKSIIAKKIFE